MDWSIQEIARLTGTTSRTLRHFGDIGLLLPTRTGANGYRFYDREALIRPQRILLLRELGLGLGTIGDVLEQQIDIGEALHQHLEWLRRERQRLGDQIRALKTTIVSLEGKEPLMATDIFNGFDHTRYKVEVIERWGQKAWESGNSWWERLSDAEKQAFQDEQASIAHDFGVAWLKGLAPESDALQAITQRHFDWLSQTGEPDREHFIGLGRMYVDDPRFAVNYDKKGAGTAMFIRDAMQIYAERNL